MVQKTLLFLFLATVVFLSVASAEDDPVFAEAGSITYKKSDFERLLTYSSPQLDQQLKANAEMKVNLVKRLMEQRILAELARKEGLENNPEVKEQLRYILDDFFAKEYLKSAMKSIAIPDDGLKRYYEEHKMEFAIPEEVKARHILIKVAFGASPEDKKKAKDKAREVIEWLKRGEKFERLAEAYSDDAATKDKGGDLGYFPKGRMAKPFDNAAFALKPGQISDAVETDYGYHIIEVVDRKEGRTKTLEEVREEIRERLTAEATQTRIKEVVEKATQDAELKIYPERIKAR